MSLPTVRKPNKYKAKKVVHDGITFDSTIEGQRYLMLKDLQAQGVIYGLERQPQFPLYVNGNYIGKYIADFDYMDDSGRVVEDVKGMRTDVFNLKQKLVRALYDIEIQVWPVKKRKPRKKAVKLNA